MKGMRGNNTFYFLTGIIILCIGSGCTASARTRMMISNMRPMMDQMKVSLNKNSDVQMVRDAMPVSLLQLDGLIAAAPDDADLLLRAAEADSGYAFLFVADTDPHRAAELMKKSRDYALRVLMRQDEFLNAMKDGSADDFAAALEIFERDDVPALYFAASSWLAWISLAVGEDLNVTTDLPKVQMMLERVLVLDDSFNYGAAHANLGAYFASRPAFFGGNPEEADYHFKQAFTLAKEKFLVWPYLYARYYAVQTRDRALFEKTLEGIIDAPPDLLPERNFVNEAVKLKAKDLLAKADMFF